jgi:hypothetical protein
MYSTMFTSIITRTPPWVFALFFVLLALGFLQMRDRRMNLRRVLIVPIMFLALSLAGVVSAFAWNAALIAVWALGYGLIAYSVSKSSWGRTSTYDPLTQSFQVAGSSVPLVLMMSIFFLKYFVGVSMAMQASFTQDAAFPLVVSALYGAFSGAFAGRALSLLQLSKQS